MMTFITKVTIILTLNYNVSYRLGIILSSLHIISFSLTTQFYRVAQILCLHQCYFISNYRKYSSHYLISSYP